MDHTSAKAPAGKSEEQYKELEHKYKLALADYQNLLKQTAKDRRETALYANEALVLELLPVYDNLKLSIKHFSGDNSDWVKGIGQVVQQFKKVLDEAGVKEIPTDNEKFDPTTMEAMEIIETDKAEEDELIAKELKGGYILHDKVLIPARVAVYKLKN